MKKNVLIITAVFPPEPVTSATLNYDLAVGLSEKYNVTVLTPKPSRPSGFDFSKVNKDIDKRFKHIVVESYVHPSSSFLGRMKESKSFGNAAANYIAEHHNEIDFVYNDGWQLFSLYIDAKECVKYNIPYIVPIQDIYPESVLTKIPNICGFHFIIKSFLSRKDKYYQVHAVRIRTITDSMADYLASSRQIDRNKYLPVANWQNDEEFNDYKTNFRKNGKTVFMFVGNNNKQANVELMIRAYHTAKLENAEFRIMGGGNAKGNCIDLANELGHKDIIFDVVPAGMVASVQKEADAMVLALIGGTGTQGVPSKLTAYMFSGKPVIASMDADADAAIMINEAKAGFVTKSDDIDSLAESFRKIANLSNTELEQMGANSRKFAEKKLSRKANLSLVCNEIDKILQ